MASLTCNMSIVIWKLRISCATSWIVSSSFYAVLSLSFVSQGIGSAPLSFFLASCIYSRTYLMSSNSFLILPLWLSASQKSSTVRSCTLSATKSTSSLVIVYSRICLWTLAFLCDPPICMIGHLSGPISCKVVADKVYCVVVSPLSCSSCIEEFYFFPICTSFFGALPFFCDVFF
jgi:hypothetical protein